MVAAMSKKHVGWWKADETRRGKELCAAATKAMAKDAGRLADCLGGVRHYLNQPITNLTAGGYATSTNEGPVQINLAKSAVDTVWSRFARSLPRTEPVTEDASWGMARQAQRLGRFLDGVKYRNDWKNTAILCLRDSLIVRGGVVQVSSVVEQRNGEAVGRILIERVFPWELFVDAGEAYYGCPRSLYKRRLLDREVAVALFGHDDKGESDEALEEAIRMRARAAGGHDGVSDSQSDQVIVWEGWHLPSAHGSGDGWHITAIEGVDQPVRTREWKRSGFPFAFLHYTPPVVGMWGHDLVGEVKGIHTELQELALKTQAIMAQTGRPMIVQRGPGSFSAGMDNDLRIPHIKLEGASEKSDLEMWNPPGLNADMAGMPDRLISLAFQMTGISMLSAASMKPAGLDSGIALREYQDIEDQRFVPQGEAIQRFELQSSTLVVEEAVELHERGVTVEVSSRRRRHRRTVLERIRWDEIDLDQDAYELQVFPASTLPRTPGGRLAMVEQLIAAGFLGREDAMRLMDLPDVERVMSEQLAPYYLLLDIIEDAIEEKRYVPPIPEMDLGMARRVMSLAIMQAELDDVPQDRIALLRQFVVAVDTLQQQAQAGANPGGMANPDAGFVPQPQGQLQAGLPQNEAPQGAAVLGVG
jgi:hypothetical protein